MFSLNLIVRKCGNNSTHQSKKSFTRDSSRWLRVTFLFLMLMVDPVSAQNPTKPLHVATGLATPFVIEGNGQMTEFSIDLWRSISQEMNVKSQLLVNPTTQDLLSSIKSGKADVGDWQYIYHCRTVSGF